MELAKIDFSKLNQPLRVLLEGNMDTWNSLLAVVESLSPEQLAYKHPGHEQRTIAEMIGHSLDTQHNFYTLQLVLSRPHQPLYTDLSRTVAEAQRRVIETFAKTTALWQGLKGDDFTKEVKTDWGQTLTGELALFQSITHTHYHVSEICFLRGLGGFPTTAMG